MAPRTGKKAGGDHTTTQSPSSSPSKQGPAAAAASQSTITQSTASSWWHALITAQDLEQEEELARVPFTLKPWLRYLEHKKEDVDATGGNHQQAVARSSLLSNNEALYFLYERAIKQLPGSYKLWKRYLDLRREELRLHTEDSQDDDNDEKMNGEGNGNGNGMVVDADWSEEERAKRVQMLFHCYERALVFLNKMPRIWLDFCEVLMAEGAITRTRRTFDRALRALPITQHKRIWEEYLDFVKECGVVETAIRVQKRYMKLEPGYAEDFIDYLLSVRRYNEAAEEMITLLNADPYTSKRGKTVFQLWMEMAELLCEHPKDIRNIRVEDILRSGIKRYTDQVGKLWNSLARYWILLGNFEKARDIYEEAMASVSTVRDFIQVFDAYAEFEEAVLSAKITQDNAADVDDIELDMRLARFERLMDRRPFLVNDVHLRQNPNNVSEWMKRVELWGDNGEKVVETYETAFATIDPHKAHGRFQDLWISFAEFQENKAKKENASTPDLEKVRSVFDDAINVEFKHPDSLAEVYIAYADMELRHGHSDRAIEILARGTTTPRNLRRPINSVNYLDASIPVHMRLFKSIKLWSHYVDMEEALGTVESAKAVYDRIMELKICTPQTVVNYAAFLEDNKYYEESYKVYERGIELFGYPIAFDLWNLYLEKFVQRYGGSKLERARDLFEQALQGCPEKYCKAIYLMYGKLEETHGLAKKAMQIYDRATRAVPPADRYEMFNFYIVKAVDFFGLTSARPIYERALEVLSDKHTRDIGLRFAALEVKLGEIERARAIYGHISQLCDPRADNSFWKSWHDFEVRHGNEETFKEMLRIKRSVQARYNNEVNFLSQQVLVANARQRAEERTSMGGNAAAMVSKPSMTFVSGGTTVNGRKVEGTSGANGGAPAHVNPDEIVMDDVLFDDDMDVDGGADAKEQEDVESTLPKQVAFVGAKERLAAATEGKQEANEEEEQ